MESVPNQSKVSRYVRHFGGKPVIELQVLDLGIGRDTVGYGAEWLGPSLGERSNQLKALLFCRGKRCRRGSTKKTRAEGP